MHSDQAHALLRQGTVIPAHLLALNSRRKLDAKRQRALSRYYLDAGAGGLAVGVHATQFAIRGAGLYETVLRLAMEEAKGRVPDDRRPCRQDRAGEKGSAASRAGSAITPACCRSAR